MQKAGYQLISLEKTLLSNICQDLCASVAWSGFSKVMWSLLWLRFTRLSDWLKKRETDVIDLLACAFARLTLITCVCFEF